MTVSVFENTRRGTFASLLILAATLTGSKAQADAEMNENPLKASARVELRSPDTKEGKVVIELNLDEPYKAYADRFKLVLESPQGAELTEMKLEPLIQFMDTFTKKMKDGIKKHGTMTATLKLQSPDPKGLKLKLTYQACTTEHCLFPKSIPLEPTIVQGVHSAEAPTAPVERQSPQYRRQVAQPLEARRTLKRP